MTGSYLKMKTHRKQNQHKAAHHSRDLKPVEERALPSERGAVETVQDVTDHSQMERELKKYSKQLEKLVEKRTGKLRENEEHFRSVADYASEAIITIDTHGRVVFWNKAAETMFGYHPDEAAGKLATFVIPKRLRKKYRDSVKSLILTGRSDFIGRTFEFVGLRKDGCEFPIGFSFSVWRTKKASFFTGIIRDISERKKAEEALRNSEERFRAVAANTGDWIWEVDAKGSFTYSSPTVERILGYEAEEVTGRPFYDFFHPDDKEQLKSAALEAFKKKEAFANFISRNVHKDDHIVVLETCGAPVLDVYGKVLGYKGSSRGITEIKRTEERLSALNFYAGKLNTAENAEQIYELALDAMERMLGFEHAAFMVIQKGNLRIASQRGYTEPLSLRLPLDGARRGITVKAANTGRPIIVPDVKKDKDYVKGAPYIRSELAVPIEMENKALGVLDVESREIGMFNDKDAVLLQILAAHVATALSNTMKRGEIENRSSQMTSLMKSSAEMIHSADLRRRLQTIAEAILELGWRRVVISARSENLDITSPEDIVTAGLKDNERAYLWTNRQPGSVWSERFGPEFGRFKIGEFYHLPWSDPWVRRKFSKGTVLSHLSQKEMVDWDPQDLLYAPLRLADGRIVGVVSVDDPVDGRRPTKESLAPLELFLHQAAVAIENAKLIQQLAKAKAQLTEYADQLELKVKERTINLRESEEKLRSIFVASPDAITVTDLNGTIIECNQAVLDMHRYNSKEELTGKSVAELFAKKNRQRAVEDFKRIVESGSVKYIEYRFLTKDGREFPAELSASVIPDALGNPVAFVVIAKDISERKQMEQQLLRSERLAAIGELAGMIGHDLRNPLTGIAGAEYYLKTKLGSRIDDKAKEMLKIIERDIEYSNKIINDLLEYSREIKLEFSASNPRSIIEQALSLVEAPANIQVSDSSQNRPRVRVDIGKMKRVFVNIIKNAIDAMPKGGTLAIGSKKTGDSVEFSFSDTGVGMPKETLQKLWAPLFTTKAKGMGFGLAICKKIVEAHGGKISVESFAGKGTTFRIAVPIAPRIEEGGEQLWVNVPESLLWTTMKV